MSDDFIPFNQSTPVNQKKWQNDNQQQVRYQNNWQNGNQRQERYQNHWKNGNHQRRGHSGHWSNISQNSNSFGSEGNTSYDRRNKPSIEAYLHPSMLEDPWEKLERKMQSKQNLE